MFPSWYHHKIYANLTATSQFSVHRNVIASLSVFFKLDIKFFRNHNAARWPWGGIRFLPCLECLVNRTAASRRPCGGLTLPLRRPYGKLVVAATTMRVPYGRLPVSLWSPITVLISWIVRSPCGRRNISDHSYHRPQDLTILKNHILQTVDRRTVRRPYGGRMICDWGMIDGWTACGISEIANILMFPQNSKP